MIEIKKQSGQGFSIVEILVAMTLASIIIVVMTSVFVFTYGDVLRAQVRADMVQESQLFLRRITEDIRVASGVRTANILADPNGDTWNMGSPVETLIATQSAVDSSDNLLYDPLTNEPYLHEVVYFLQDATLQRRLIANTASGSPEQSTCPLSDTSGCPADAQLLSNVNNVLFSFYDRNGASTTVADDARSVEVLVGLGRRVYGQDVVVENNVRMTLRNE